MAQSTESTNAQLPRLPEQKGFRHYGDGIAGPIDTARLQAFNTTTLLWEDVRIDNVTGGIVTTGSAGGGGPATIADGADVTQGALADAAIITNTTGTLNGKLRGLVAILADVWDSVNHRLKVDGSAVTQPVSAVSLPLPTGAATETTLGTRLADATFTTRVNTQGQKTMATSTPVVLASDQSGVPVTGTFFQATQPVSAVSLPLPAGAATDASLTNGTQRIGGTVAVSNATSALETGGQLQIHADLLRDILTELRVISFQLQSGLNVQDEPSSLRADLTLVS